MAVLFHRALLLACLALAGCGTGSNDQQPQAEAVGAVPADPVPDAALQRFAEAWVECAHAAYTAERGSNDTAELTADAALDECGGEEDDFFDYMVRDDAPQPMSRDDGRILMDVYRDDIRYELVARG